MNVSHFPKKSIIKPNNREGTSWIIFSQPNLSRRIINSKIIISIINIIVDSPIVNGVKKLKTFGILEIGDVPKVAILAKAILKDINNKPISSIK